MCSLINEEPERMNIKIIINQKFRRRVIKDLGRIMNNKMTAWKVNVQYTASQDHARLSARHAAREHVDVIVAVGGDGTVNSVLNGIVGTNVALGVIPAGTANDFASHCRIP